MFTPPEDLKGFSVAGLTDLAKMASAEHETLRASIDPETVTDDQVSRLSELQSFVASAAAELEARQTKAAELAAASTIASLPAPVEPAEIVQPVETVTASTFDAAGNKDVTATTPSPTGEPGQVLEGTIVAAGAVNADTRRSVQPADVACLTSNQAGRVRFPASSRSSPGWDIPD